MQKKEINELELDMRELMLLLKEAHTREELIPVLKRHINRLIKTLERVNDDLDVVEEGVPVYTDQIIASVEAENVTEQESVTIEEVVVSPEIIKHSPESKEEVQKQREEQEVVNLVAPPTIVLGEQLRPAAELSKGLTLNDTFRFSRELFDGDKDKMNRVLKEISMMDSLADVTSYVSSQIEWDEESEVVKDFIELLKKYFV